MATEDKRKNPLDVWFKKGLAVEEHHPAILFRFHGQLCRSSIPSLLFAPDTITAVSSLFLKFSATF